MVVHVGKVRVVLECGRRDDQAQRCDGGHKYQPYVSRAAVSWSRDPVE